MISVLSFISSYEWLFFCIFSLLAESTEKVAQRREYGRTSRFRRLVIIIIRRLIDNDWRRNSIDKRRITHKVLYKYELDVI